MYTRNPFMRIITIVEFILINKASIFFQLIVKYNNKKDIK